MSKFEIYESAKAIYEKWRHRTVSEIRPQWARRKNYAEASNGSLHLQWIESQNQQAALLHCSKNATSPDDGKVAA